MDKHCDGCEQKDRCAEVYEKLGHSEGPNVASKAVAAFIVPVAAFVAAVLIAQPFLKNKIENAKLMVLIELAIGLAAAAAAVFIVRRLTRKDSSGHIQCPEKEKHLNGNTCESDISGRRTPSGK
jgi:hypothetical protein